jgi:uncharacterized protein
MGMTVEKARKEAQTLASKAAAAAARAEQLAASEIQSALKALEDAKLRQTAEKVQSEAQAIAAAASAAAAKAGKQVADEVQSVLKSADASGQRFARRARKEAKVLGRKAEKRSKQVARQLQSTLDAVEVPELVAPAKKSANASTIFWRAVGIAALIGIAIVLYRTIKQYREDSVFELAPAGVGASGAASGEKRGISTELLEILADPGDKGPVELMTDADGKEWLINRRNGYRYPVEDGIPIMLLEEGEKHKDESLIS